jgi:hypothetical protein
LLFFFFEGFHERAVAFGGYTPVNGSDIVAILVRTHIVELQSRSFEDRVKVSLHLAVDRLAYLYLVPP